MEYNIERKLPICLQVDGAGLEATLLVHVSFAEIRSDDTTETIQNSSQSEKKDGFFKLARGLTRYKKKNKETKDQVSSCYSDESSLFNSSCSPTTSTSSEELSSGTESVSSASSETQLDPVIKNKLFSWKRRKLSFRRKQEPSIENSSVINHDDVEENVSVDQQQQVNIRDSVQELDQLGSSAKLEAEDVNCITSIDWEMKELVSRDGQAKLKANVFFASFDQRSEEASGESACTAIVAVMADWLHSNPDSNPTRTQFDSLITEGCSVWRKLCDNDAYVNFFPDKHFDLETVLEADLRPIFVSRERSFTGFFSPEKFESLKEAMSFDQIWDAIRSSSNNADKYTPMIYIVSWNDHFFVLKAEANAFYIIDSLGERLFEGCNQAYILKFDDSSLMHGKVVQEEGEQKQESEEIICRGKECCREYIKRFLAAISLRELEEEENKKKVSAFSLLQRLQIDFNYCSSSSSFTTSFSSSEKLI